MYVAIYCRTSTGTQEKGLEAQRRALLEYCKSKGIVNYKVFEDFGVSGAKSSRPALNKMMRKVNDGEVSSVVVYSFSRFARSTKHLLGALETFKEKDVGFISITESVDTFSPMGRAFFTIISAISQLERELISERVKNGLKNAKAKGSQLGRPKTHNTELIVSLRRQGYTYKQIRDLLGVGHGTITSAIKEADGNESDLD
jgi:DNA invertase Pin-like site-specific DNA recombinase